MPFRLPTPHRRRVRTPHEPNDSGYRPGLDGLRAVSVLVVVAFHAGVFGAGWIGVDVFFALSGWLITGLLVAEFERTGDLALGSFWARRARRLLPAIGVLLVVALVLAWMNAIELRTRGVVGAVTYSTNWLDITGGGSYWDEFARPDPFRHLWSLAIEEQIYLVWPVALKILASRRSIRHATRTAAGAVVVASAAVMYFGAHAGWSVDRLYQGTDTRAMSFALGSLFAGVSLRRLGDRLGSLLLVAALVVASWLGRNGVDGTDIFRGRMFVVSVCGLVAVLVAAGLRSGPLCHPVVRRIGLWSYGIYLFHFPLVVALDEWSRWPRTIVVTVAAVAIAGVSFTYVERPVRERRVPRLALVSGAALVAVVSVLAFSVAEGVAPSADETAMVTLPPPVDSRPRVLVLGDSVPALASRQIVDVGRSLGFDVGVVASPACVASPFAIDQYVGSSCTDFIGSLDETVRESQPDVVVWWWGMTGIGLQWDGTKHEFCSAETGPIVEERTAWLASLSEGHPTAFVTPIPRTDRSDDDAAATHCEIESIESALGRLEVPVLRLDEVVCPSFPDSCDRIPRRDGLHFTEEGAESAAAWLFEQLSGPTFGLVASG